MKIELNGDGVETLSDLGKSYYDGCPHEDALIVYRKAMSIDVGSSI